MHRLFKSGLATVIYDDELVDANCGKLFQLEWLHANSGGQKLERGTAVMFQYGGLELVFKQYHRGGLIGRWIAKTYRYCRLKNTRVWREFHMLDATHKLGLPVPRPVAACCTGITPIAYRGAVITERVPGSKNLTEILCEQPLSNELWGKLGTLIARFHTLNVFHADLNTSNILLADKEKFYLVDFDKGEVRTPLSRKDAESNVARLHRSLNKLQGRHPAFCFSEDNWQALTSAYQRAINSD
ncbi:3-deoxy-D-manno-octulosonic acid kinase [Zhongshania aliphaticivorans]|uniref:3-deoxy-D-manno-octulosonic acid kinase n=1 Tax=Zhongshania aliphaticivorans TaxID=1470434 RepID=UPI00132FE436|nr:3-deoxy-D-manno-octulosonic acid kinase [Zhongshania aliphaticivorans]